jgi:hypothetical protein
MGKLLGKRGVGVSGRMRIGAEAGIRSGKWSVIMDWFCFALVRMRRPLVRFAVSSLRRRDALEKCLTDNLPLVDRVRWAGA